MTGILWGICGLGRGHVYRQLPLIREFCKTTQVMVLTYGDALLPIQREAALPGRMLSVLEVDVPMVAGGKNGINWMATARIAADKANNWAVNGRALARVEQMLGCPDLVVSDYEPTAASYAYAVNAPLVTYDQQSKFLNGRVSVPDVSGYGPDDEIYGPADEIARLRMFFPRAACRISSSFFPVIPLEHPHEHVLIVPPVLRQNILDAGLQRTREDHILIYLSPQSSWGHDPRIVQKVLQAYPTQRFHVYGDPRWPDQEWTSNVEFHKPEDGCFDKLLLTARALVCTAGHSVLSEAVYLGLPILALPGHLYEQQANAMAIRNAGHGHCSRHLDVGVLGNFLDALEDIGVCIQQGNTGLLHGTGPERVINLLRACAVTAL